MRGARLLLAAALVAAAISCGNADVDTGPSGGGVYGPTQFSPGTSNGTGGNNGTGTGGAGGADDGNIFDAGGIGGAGGGFIRPNDGGVGF